MKGFLQAFAAIGLVLIGVVRFCARVGDDVIDVARRVDVPSGGARYLDDMGATGGTMSRTLYPQLANAEDLLKRYPGARYKTPRTEDALEFLDYAGEVYDQFSDDEEEAFWEHAPTISGFGRSQNWLNLQVYKHYKAHKDFEELNTNYRHYALADSLLPHLLTLNTHETDIPNEDLMLSALANEIRLRRELAIKTETYPLNENASWTSINQNDLYSLFGEYFLLRYELLKLKRGTEIVKQFDRTFFGIIPFVPLKESYKRSKNTLLTGFNHLEHPESKQMALGLFLHEEIDESKARLFSFISGKEIAPSPDFLKDWAYVRVAVDSLVSESIHGIDTFPKTDAAQQGLFGVKNVVYSSNVPKGIADYFRIARYENVWSEEQFISTLLTANP